MNNNDLARELMKIANEMIKASSDDYIERRSRGIFEATKKLTQEQIENLKRLYVEENLSTIQVAKMMGLSHATVWQNLKRLGVETRTVKKLTPEQINDLKRLYLEENLSTIQIAKMMGFSQPAIYRHLKSLGVDTRARGTEKRKLTSEQINDIKRLYEDENLSITQIAEMMGVNSTSILYHINRLGVDTRPKEKLTEDQVQDVIRLYTVHEVSANRIAKMMGVTPSTILHCLKRSGVETRPITKKLTPEKINDLKRLYLDENLSINQIAKMMGVNVATIWQHLKRRGVEMRPRR